RTRGGRRRNGGKRRNKNYCIHGHCTYLQDLKEPVCVCMKGYDGVRCGIQLLQTFSGSGSGSDGPDGHSHTHTLQLALVIIAVVLSVISCAAIIIIIMVQYVLQNRSGIKLSTVSRLRS
uniref:Amphiregulin n=1 Tax=Pygocentrus nattereri TaxID=42514 RepID=A0A3B4CXK6_PYGNA